jgi:uncharacterized protein YcbK (DUF882 family)
VVYSGERREPGKPAPADHRTPVTRSVSSALLDPRAQSTAYVTEIALDFVSPLRGRSGKVKAAFRTPGEVVTDQVGEGMSAVYEEDGHSVESEDFTAPQDPGIYKLAVALGKVRRPVSDLSVITLVPFSQKKNERIGLYYLGSWPYESGGTPKSASYANPVGFIEVTKQNRATNVSEHFRLQDFLTKDQHDVWPKYLLLEPKMVDKLELVIQELEAAGHPVKHMQVMSGFRTPRYNKGGGNTAGRASLSRHMYGDGADVFVDNDRNNVMDDLNGDGRSDVRDAEVVAAATDRVEKKHPALVGGVGTYPPCCGHGAFTHVDTRGYRARWRGSGTG